MSDASKGSVPEAGRAGKGRTEDMQHGGRRLQRFSGSLWERRNKRVLDKDRDDLCAPGAFRTNLLCM